MLVPRAIKGQCVSTAFAAGFNKVSRNFSGIDVACTVFVYFVAERQRIITEQK